MLLADGYRARPVEVTVTAEPPEQTGADTVCVGLFEGDGAPAGLPPEAAALVESGEARGGLRRIAVAHADGRRWLLIGLGDRTGLDTERARLASAVAVDRARDLRGEELCWRLPEGAGPDVAAGLVEGTLLGGYRFLRYKTDPDGSAVQRLVVSDGEGVEDAVREAAVVARAQNRARDLQNTPANELTPTGLADRARELGGAFDTVTVEIDGRHEIAGRGMGAFAAVAQGAAEEPALITIRYEPPEAGGPRLGLVGKAVTFDSGGISIKPAAKMHEMKFDMSGGAAVIESIGAVAELGLPVRVIAVVGATENMPSGTATRPGDIVRSLAGPTIEINNTDAEGRLVLADCLAWAREQGAERLVDVATLTGAIVVALGSTHAGLFSNDDGWADEVEAAARETGELVWRFPLHPEYADLVKGQYADVVNAPEQRKAMSIAAAEFLKRFVGDVPWAHVDIAGTAYDVGRPYTGKSGSGFGVRLLVSLARRAAAEG